MMLYRKKHFKILKDRFILLETTMKNILLAKIKLAEY